MVDPAQRPSPPPARRGFLASLLVVLGLRPASSPATRSAPVQMVERNGWLLDAKDR